MVKRKRAGRGCTCRGGLQLSSHPLCKERHRYREEEREREQLQGWEEEEEEEESTVQVRDGRKRKQSNVVSSKRPPASAPVCTHIKP